MPRDYETANAIDRAVGAKIREARLNRGWTQENLAAAVGVTFQQIQKYENGRNRTSASALVLIGRALGVKPPSFLEGVDDAGVQALSLDIVRGDPILVRQIARLANPERTVVRQLVAVMAEGRA